MQPVARTPCPSDDTLAALVGKALDPGEAAQVTSHLDDCVICQQIMLAVVRGGVAAAVTEVPGEPPDPHHGRPRATRIGRYQLRGMLGIGGMGAVYDAYDAELDRAVALKVLRPGLDAAPGLADRLVRESRLMAKVAHPSVIAVYDVGRDGDVVFIAMELIRGTTLRAWLTAHDLDWHAIVALFERAGHGLAAAHGAGIVHRDFKPDNVLVAHGSRKVVVTDFGIARELALPQGEHGAVDPHAITTSASGNLALTRDGAVLGTPAYMAPEQLAGKPVDHRADVFAFAASLWEALFRGRPFPGSTIAEIFAAMHRPLLRPAPGARRVPHRLLRALRKGLAIDPRDRWPDLPAMLRELAAIRGSRRRTVLAIEAAGLVGVTIAAVLVVTRPAPAVDRCRQALAALDDAYNPGLAHQLAAVLAADPPVRAAVTGKLAAIAASWRSAQRATCRADREVIQDATTTACLDARRLELAAAVDDVIANGADGARYATRISELPGAPAACAAPAPGMLFTRVPADRALRRQVTALRDRLLDADDARDLAEFKRALAIAAPVVSEAAALWPPLHAEALLALGKIQRIGGDSQLAATTLREAAVSAERVHHDEVAARGWAELAHSVASDQGDAPRALEYTTYAEAAADRIGRPPALMSWLEYVRSRALVSGHRSHEAELALRHSAELARIAGDDELARTFYGLGSLYQAQGRFVDAVAAYRTAVDHLPRSPSGEIIGPPRLFTGLAVTLSLIGQPAEAELQARRAVAIADLTMPETQLDRATAHHQLAWTLQNAGRASEALPEIAWAVAATAKNLGTRSLRYGTTLAFQGEILTDAEHYAEAEPMLARACEIIAFAVGDDDSRYATCEVRHAKALIGLHREAEALPKLDRAVGSLVTAHGETYPTVAYTLTLRGKLRATLGHHPAAIADFERAVAALATAQLEPSYMAVARWRLGKELWPAQPARARAEVVDALALFDRSLGSWRQERDEAAAWLARHDRPVQAQNR